MEYFTIKRVENKNSAIQIEERCSDQYRITAISLSAGHSKSIILDYYSSIEQAVKAFNFFLKAYKSKH